MRVPRVDDLAIESTAGAAIDDGVLATATERTQRDGTRAPLDDDELAATARTQRDGMRAPRGDDKTAAASTLLGRAALGDESPRCGPTSAAVRAERDVILARADADESLRRTVASAERGVGREVIRARAMRAPDRARGTLLDGAIEVAREVVRARAMRAMGTLVDGDIEARRERIRARAMRAARRAREQARAVPERMVIECTVDVGRELWGCASSSGTASEIVVELPSRSRTK